MSQLRRASILAVLLSTSVAVATEVVILGGGKTVQEAEASGRAFQAAHEAFTPGFPKRMRSDDLPGLKPGFQLLVAGFCSDKAAAQRAAKALNTLGKGVYTRPVTAAQPESCPNAEIAADPQSAPFLKRIAAEPRSVGARYALAAHLYERGLLDEAEVQLEEALRIDPEHGPSRDLLRTISVLKMD